MGSKRIFFFIGLLALIASLFACGNNDSTTGADDSHSDKVNSSSSQDWASRPCDTTIVDTIHTKLIIYTDTVYDTTETYLHYISFAYEKDSLGTLDTLTVDSTNAFCGYEGDSVSYCVNLIILKPDNPLYSYDLIALPVDATIFEPVVVCDTCPRICHDWKYVYDDTTYTTNKISTINVNCDTTFVNYGENALAQNIIPYKMEISALTPDSLRQMFKEFPADSTLQFDAYEILDFCNFPEFKEKHKTDGLVYEEGKAQTNVQTFIRFNFLGTTYPSDLSFPNGYEITNNYHPENDTTITWSLGISKDGSVDTLMISTTFKK